MPWVLLFFSLNTTPDNLFYLYNLSSPVNFYSIINFFRALFPIIIFIILLTFFFKKKFKFDIICKLLFIYIFFQFIGFLFFPLNIFQNIYWIISSLSVVLLTNNLLFYKKDYSANIIKIYLLLMMLVVIFFLYKIYSNYFSLDSFIGNSTSTYSSKILMYGANYFNQPTIRSTGLSRQLLLIYLFICIVILYSKNNKYYPFYYFLAFIFCFSIWSLQSRTVLYFLFIFFLIFFTSFFNISFFKKIKFALVVFILPAFLYFSEPIIKNKLLLVHQTQTQTQTQPQTQPQTQTQTQTQTRGKFNENFQDYNRWIYEKSSSGRLSMWKESIKYIIKSPIYGYGPLADRIIIKENISNVYFYSLLCGGVIGFAMIVLVNVIVLYNIFKLLFFYKIFNSPNLILLKISIIYILFFIFRSLVEVSYGVYSLDFFIFLLSCVSVSRYLKSTKI